VKDRKIDLSPHGHGDVGPTVLGRPIAVRIAERGRRAGRDGDVERRPAEDDRDLSGGQLLTVSVKSSGSTNWDRREPRARRR
jgi:hypothetical protein